MNCPYCDMPSQEADPACRSCGFSITVADQMFGMPPSFNVGITDAAQILKPTDTRKIEKQMAETERLFPQVKISVITSNLPPTIPMKAFSFWVMNRAGVCMQMHRGPASRTLLLGVDVQSKRGSAMVGYGLEPFIGHAQLEPIVATMVEHIAAGKNGQAIVGAIDQFADTLEQIWGSLGETYGIDMEQVQSTGAARIGGNKASAVRALAKTQLVEY